MKATLHPYKENPLCYLQVGKNTKNLISHLSRNTAVAPVRSLETCCKLPFESHFTVGADRGNYVCCFYMRRYIPPHTHTYTCCVDVRNSWKFLRNDSLHISDQKPTISLQNQRTKELGVFRRIYSRFDAVKILK